MTDNARGALLMMLGMAAFTCSDAAMKAVGQTLPLFQSVFLRGILVGVIFLALALRFGALTAPMAPRDRKLLICRVAAEALASWFFFLALFNMPLANVTAILLALPLTLTLAGALFLRERVGWRRLSMIVLGFAGVLLIVRPGTDGFDHHAIYALLAVVAVTLRDLVTRQMSAGMPSLQVASWTAFGIVAFGAVGSLTETWVMPGPELTGLLMVSSVFIILGYMGSIMAVRIGELAVVAPFRYTGLIWAVLLGLAFFGEWPDALTKLGAALIVATGLYTFLRERQLARAARRRHTRD